MAASRSASARMIWGDLTRSSRAWRPRLTPRFSATRSTTRRRLSGGLGGKSPYFTIFEADFDSLDDMQKGLGSPEGKAVAADVPNYATGGANIIHYEVVAGSPA
jgi:uncharacterized protein (TIGR02118 family)